MHIFPLPVVFCCFFFKTTTATHTYTQTQLERKKKNARGLLCFFHIKWELIILSADKFKKRRRRRNSSFSKRTLFKKIKKIKLHFFRTRAHFI